MMLASTPPNHLMRRAWMEVMGESKALTASADKAFSFSLLNDIRARYDAITADGILILLGRAFFMAWLHDEIPQVFLLDSHFRWLPFSERIEQVLQNLQMAIETWLGVSASLQREGDILRWEIATPTETGFFWQGVVFSAAAWVSGDKYYPVSLEPRASLNRCIIKLSLNPIGA